MWFYSYGVAAALLLAVLFLGLPRFLRAYRKFRGVRVITCPENQQPAAVKVDAWGAGRAAATGQMGLRLKTCSRWPERRDCGQQCLAQIEAAPEDCLVRNILANWYAGKNCVYCQKPLDAIHWMEHHPAVMSPEGKTLEWSEIRPETIPAVLATHRPVCWNCHVAETFRYLHPELVVDREWRHAGSRRG